MNAEPLLTRRVRSAKLLIASLADIIKSKRAAGRSRDLAVLDVLQRTLDEQESAQEGKNESRRPKGGK